MGESGNNRRKGMMSHVAVARSWRTLFISAGICLVLLLAQQHTVYAAGFTVIGNMTSDRMDHTSTTLADGRVLITGGTSGASTTYLKSAEIYDPATNAFTPTGSMTTVRAFHTATRLPNGKVLITGGTSGSPATSANYLNSAEIFDPATGAFTLTTGSMDFPRAYHTATLLNDGTVLVAGGKSGSASSTTLAAAQIYNPATGTFSATNGPLSVGRRLHTATLLNDGRVLFAGGRTTATTTNSAEIYTTAAKTFVPVTATLTLPRNSHVAVLLTDGRVLLTGGFDANNSILNSAEIFDPTGAGAFSSTAAPMASGRLYHTATRLLNGKVLIAGGYSTLQVISASAELFDPANGGSFTPAGTMTSARASHSAALLNNGTVVMSGGKDASFITLSSTELYDSAALRVSPAVYRFPDANVSEPSIPQIFTITNSGSVGLTLNSIGFSGTDGSMFTLSTDSCGPLPHLLTANASCSISVNFIPTSGGLKTASLDITSTDPVKPVVSAALRGTGIGALQPTLTIVFDGTGAGSTTSAQVGLTCLSSQSAPCQAQVAPGTIISVSPTPDKDSLFTGWTGACSGVGTCTITVNTNSSVGATFSYVEPARINSTYYPSLQEAYAGVVAGVGTVIQTRIFTFTGPLVLDQNIGVTLKGGYDLNYSPIPVDYSVVNGKLSISNGSAKVQRIIVR